MGNLERDMGEPPLGRHVHPQMRREMELLASAGPETRQFDFDGEVGNLEGATFAKLVRNGVVESINGASRNVGNGKEVDSRKRLHHQPSHTPVNSVQPSSGGGIIIVEDQSLASPRVTTEQPLGLLHSDHAIKGLEVLRLRGGDGN